VGRFRWDGSGGTVQVAFSSIRAEGGVVKRVLSGLESSRVVLRAPVACQRVGSNQQATSRALGAGAENESDYFLRCRILARFRRFLRPILRRPLPDFFVPMWLFARNTLVGHGDRMAMLAKQDSSRTGDVEQLRRAMHCQGPDGGKRRVGSLSCSASECEGHGDRLEHRGRS
jgi:hypothetical protein